MKKEVKIDDTTIYPEDLTSPCQEFSNGGLGIVVALLVCSRINVSSVSTGGPIQLYILNWSPTERTTVSNML